MGKFRTIAIDSGSEWARLTFSYDMRKHSDGFLMGKEQIRAVSNYPGATERINMVVRRFKDYRNRGINIVILAHEQLEKIYARGGMIAAKGQAPQEPIAVKGLPDFPGASCPQEVMRACDNAFRMRRVNGKEQWIARPEPVGGGGDDWEVKDRFNARTISNGLLPASWEELEKLAIANPACTWNPPYITLIYGTPGIGKTRALLTFPRPLLIMDIDRGADVLKLKDTKYPEGIEVQEYNSEEMDDYPKFLSSLEAAGQ